MFKLVSFLALLSIAVAAPGFVAETHVVQPVVTKLHAVPSAVSHQSFSRIHNRAHYVAPLVKTVAVAPVVKTYHAAPVLKTIASPVVHTYAAAPIVKSIASPVVHTYAAAPIVKTIASPVVHTYAAAPISYQSHVQIHQKAALVTPLVKTVVAAPVVPVVHAAPVVKYIH